MERAVAYIRSSLCYDSTEMERIRTCALENKINVALGFSENDHGSLYIAQCVITDNGEIKAKRRKLKPTHMERTVFGDCTGDSLLNVVDTSVGRVGALSCWEHINPLLKYHTFYQRELYHVAAWPPVRHHSGGSELFSMSREGMLLVLGSIVMLRFADSLFSSNRNSHSCSDVCHGIINFRNSHNLLDIRERHTKNGNWRWVVNERPRRWIIRNLWPRWQTTHRGPSRARGESRYRRNKSG